MQDELLELYFEDMEREIDEAYSQFKALESSGAEFYEFIKRLKNMEVASSMLGISSNSDFILGIKEVFISANEKGLKIGENFREKAFKTLEILKKYVEIQKEKHEKGLEIEFDNPEELEEKAKALSDLELELEKVLENTYNFELYNVKMQDKVFKVLQLSGNVEFLKKDGKIILNYCSKLKKEEILNLFSSMSIPYFTIKGANIDGKYESLNEFYINLEINRENVKMVYEELRDIRESVKECEIIDNFKNSDIYAVQLLESFKS